MRVLDGVEEEERREEKEEATWEMWLEEGEWRAIEVRTETIRLKRDESMLLDPEEDDEVMNWRRRVKKVWDSSSPLLIKLIQFSFSFSSTSIS